MDRLSYAQDVNTSDLITVDPEILGGTPVFKGTRVPVRTLFDYLERDYTLEEFGICPVLARQRNALADTSGKLPD